MLEDCAKLWWDDITGPATYVRMIVDNLAEAKSVILIVPEDIPWHNQMYSSTSQAMREYDPELLLEFIDCQDENFSDSTGKTNIPFYLLDHYAYPDVKNGYRQSSGQSIQQYLVSKKVLLNRIIWVTNASAEQASEWIQFCREYRAKKRYDGLFVIETTESVFNYGVRAGSNMLNYNEFTTYYDTLLFNNIVCSKQTGSMEWLQYKATALALICNYDAELSGYMLNMCDFKAQSPIDALRNMIDDSLYTQRYDVSRLSKEHPISVICSNEINPLNHALWKAQLQVIFPMIEAERIQIIERYRDEIEEAVKTEYFDFNRYINRYVTQYGERLESAFDAEVGTLYRMNHLRRASDTSLYLFFLPNEDDRVHLALLHDMRNSIAHVEPCSVELVDQFFAQYPYKW